MDCQEITGRAKRGCDLGKCRGDTAGREGNCCEVPEDRECRGHQKHCSKPRPRARSYCHLLLDKQWSGASAPFVRGMKCVPLPAAPGMSRGQKLGSVERYWVSV